jgi:transglutaminase-like putative cysteine protease
MNNIHALNIKSDETHSVENDFNIESSDLMETYYCDFSNKEIEKVAKNFLEYKQNTRELVTKIFLFVREKIVFGGDRWKVKASETLKKGYGACYNKNILLIALLRYHGISSKLCANPMSKDFAKAAMGFGYVTISTPFYHCFTKVLIDEKWVDVDPTLDKNTYDTFFCPLNVDWNIDWDGYNDMLLYKGSSIGNPKIYKDIDSAFEKNLNSHFLFRYEPEFLISLWLFLGNLMMWKQIKNPPKG